jgi:protein ImuB
VQRAEVGLARPADTPDRIRPLLALKLEGLHAGFGFDVLRLEALDTEPVYDIDHQGPGVTPGTAMSDLINRLGARLGMEAVTRLHPAESHIPEKTFTVHMAAFSQPHPGPWPEPRAPRPLTMFRPEPVHGGEGPQVPLTFRWRRREFRTARSRGPERIAPEWWLDDPAWRSGVRDYWFVQTEDGTRLWLFYAHGGQVSGGWFCQGRFA